MATYQQAKVNTTASHQKNHNLAYGAVGAVAGLAGGALLMHEGHKVGMFAMAPVAHAVAYQSSWLILLVYFRGALEERQTQI